MEKKLIHLTLSVEERFLADLDIYREEWERGTDLAKYFAKQVLDGYRESKGTEPIRIGYRGVG